MQGWYLVFDPVFHESQCDYFDEIVEEFLRASAYSLEGLEPARVAEMWEAFLLKTLRGLEAIERQPEGEGCVGETDRSRTQ